MTASWIVDTGDNPATYRVERVQGCAIVTATGEIDVHSAAGLRRALAQAATFSDWLVVDLSEVSFIDSTGLGVLLRARGRGQRRSISLVNPPQMLRKVLHLTTLNQILPVYPSRQAALDEARREQEM